MTDLLASTALTLSPPGLTPRTAPVALPGRFDLALAIDRPMPALALPTGKAIAGGGKGLPVAGGLSEAEAGPAIASDASDEDEELLAWVPAGLIPLPVEAARPAQVIAGDAATVPMVVPQTVGIVSPASPDATIPSPVVAPSVQAGAAPAVDTSEALPLLPTTPAGPVNVGQADVALPSDAAATVVAGATPVSTPLRTLRAVPAQAEPRVGGGVVAAEVRIDRAAAATPEITLRAPAPAIAPIVQAAPAAQVFAAALAAPLVDPVDAAQPAADPASPEVQLLRAVEVQRTTVQATTQADQAPLDLSRDDWTGKMIDRIAALRDGIEAADTRIRLAPENLGSVDVSIRRDGDRIQVHFTAENPATRQLLMDAAPRLAELAEARGLKLGQSSVDGGSGERGQPHQSNQQSTPARPASARADIGAASDARVA